MWPPLGGLGYAHCMGDTHTRLPNRGYPLFMMLPPLWGLGMRIVWDMHARCGTWEPRRGDHNTGTGVNPCVHSVDTVQNPEGVARFGYLQFVWEHSWMRIPR